MPCSRCTTQRGGLVQEQTVNQNCSRPPGSRAWVRPVGAWPPLSRGEAGIQKCWGVHIWLSTPSYPRDLLGLRAPVPRAPMHPDAGGSPISASSFLALPGRWGKARGCETELSPNPPGGEAGKPVSWRRPRSWGQKNNFWVSPQQPHSCPVLLSPTTPLSRRSADFRMIPGIGKLPRHPQSL